MPATGAVKVPVATAPLRSIFLFQMGWFFCARNLESPFFHHEKREQWGYNGNIPSSKCHSHRIFALHSWLCFISCSSAVYSSTGKGWSHWFIERRIWRSFSMWHLLLSLLRRLVVGGKFRTLIQVQVEPSPEFKCPVLKIGLFITLV